MKKFTDFRGKYKGKRCFIVGNGASLNKTPLELLRDDGVTIKEYSFAMNMISLMFERTSWRPNFMVVTTSALGDPDYGPIIMDGIDAAEWSFVWDEFQELETFSNRVCYIPVLHTDHIDHQEADQSYWPKMLGKGISKFATSTFSAMQIAVYLGFNPIYLVGVDLDWKPFKRGKDINHFDQGYNHGSHSEEEYREITGAQTRAYEIAGKATKNLGVKVINATVGGRLEIFPRVDFEDLFK